MKGLDVDNNDDKTSSVDHMVQACAAEREKAARRKIVAQLASHLCMVFHINPNEQALVITLCGGNASSNLGALKYWVEMKLTDKNKAEGAAFWESELARVLNEIANSI